MAAGKDQKWFCKRVLKQKINIQKNRTALKTRLINSLLMICQSKMQINHKKEKNVFHFQ